jgi:transcriptional regulator with PAS, ATPase and Fis domain
METGQTHVPFHGIVGSSPVMRTLYERIEGAATGRGTALIVGETGTGKELVARALHDAGDPPGAPFVPVNCAALPRELIESELFGHREGAFSGASTDYVGLVRAADGGTLFLDEVTEMHPDTQAKLLRVIQERTVRRVGTTAEVPVDVRIVASTNRDPMEAIRDRKLREDLYYRLKVHTLRVPPLRERRGDLPLLCAHFIEFFNAQYRRSVGGIDADALRVLKRHGWPGNVRELMGVLESAFAFGRTNSITRRDLPLEELGVEDPDDGPPTATEAFESSSEIRAPRVVTFEEGERRLLSRALSASGGNKSRAAKLLGISRKQLYAKIRKYGVGGDAEDGTDGAS